MAALRKGTHKGCPYGESIFFLLTGKLAARYAVTFSQSPSGASRAMARPPSDPM